jgi:hypothetical protein
MPSIEEDKVFFEMEDEPWLVLAGTRALFTDTIIKTQDKREALQAHLVRRFQDSASSGIQNSSAKGFESEIILAMAVMCTHDLGKRLQTFVNEELAEQPPAW